MYTWWNFLPTSAKWNLHALFVLSGVVVHFNINSWIMYPCIEIFKHAFRHDCIPLHSHSLLFSHSPIIIPICKLTLLHADSDTCCHSCNEFAQAGTDLFFMCECAFTDTYTHSRFLLCMLTCSQANVHDFLPLMYLSLQALLNTWCILSIWVPFMWLFKNYILVPQVVHKSFFFTFKILCFLLKCIQYAY